MGTDPNGTSLHARQLWSAFVTRKADHRIVNTDPYGIMRHPIYTGIILAAVALAIIKRNRDRDHRCVTDRARALGKSATRRRFPPRTAWRGSPRYLPAPRADVGAFWSGRRGETGARQITNGALASTQIIGERQSTGLRTQSPRRWQPIVGRRTRQGRLS